MVRLYGVLVAAVVAVVVAVALSLARVGAGSVDAVQFLVVAVVAAGVAALLFATRVRAGWLHGLGEVIAMAVLTYVIGLLLFPVVQAVASWSDVSNGGRIPCLSLRPGASLYVDCPGGLHGNAAFGALIDGTLSWYPGAPVALLLFAPLLAPLLVPSTVWVLLMRFAKVDAYHRSW
jgi:hypothetical protein